MYGDAAVIVMATVVTCLLLIGLVTLARDFQDRDK